MALLEKVKLGRGRVDQHTKGLGQNQPVRASEFNDVVTYLNNRSSENTTNTVTLATNAGTLNTAYGTIITESLTTAAGDTVELIITNSLVTINSMILAVITDHTGDGSPVINVITPEAGGFVITITNLAPADALNDTLNIKFIVY